MSSKANRKRARRARQRQELLSLRAELVLLYDGQPMPLHFLELNRMETREIVRTKKFYAETPSWLKPQWFANRTPYTGKSVVAMQIEEAADELAKSIDAEVLRLTCGE